MATNDNEWQRMKTSGTTNDNEWYNEWYNEWQQVVQRVTTSNNEWKRVTTNDNEWQQMTINKNDTIDFKEWMIVIPSITKIDTLL